MSKLWMTALSSRRHFQKDIASTSRNFSKVGFIGLGNMGGPMAKNLIRQKFNVSVFDIDPLKRSALAADGARESSSLEEVSVDADCIITMLPANQHVEEAYTSQSGILNNVSPGCMLIDCSTINFKIPKRLALLAEEKSVTFIEAPVSGGVLAATEGRLSFMAGGKEADVKTAESILKKMGSKVVYCGSHGSGQVAKMCNNLLLAVSMAGVSEAMNLGIRLGLNADKLAAVINSSSGECWSSRVYNPVPGVMDGVPSGKDYEGGFSVALMLKDLNLAEQAANESGTNIPVGEKVIQMYQQIHNQGFSKKDFSIIYKYLSLYLS